MASNIEVGEERLKRLPFDLVREELVEVESILSNVGGSTVALVDAISHHILDAGGKRLRPALLLTAAHAVGHPGPEILRLAASMELLHTATLIHDDVIDQSEWRRGRRTVHSLWGQNASVLSGDVLFAKAMRLLVAYGRTPMLQTITEAIVQVCEGEVDEIAINGERDVAVTAYLRVIEAKTASLLAACCRIGALAVDAPEDQVDALGNYGRHLGLAFQIMDDLLDLVADPGLWGKPIGKDLQEGRRTLPLIYAIQQTEGADHARLLAILNNPEMTDALMSEVLEIVRRYGCLDAVREDAARHVRIAQTFLSQLPPTEARETLEALSDYVLSRDR